MHLYETHLPVQSTERAADFYREVVGLEFAYRDPGRDIVFLWVGSRERSMLGLWGLDTAYGQLPGKRHLAFAVSLPELLEFGNTLNARGIITTNFLREQTAEPSVIGWMPSVQLYFEDLDGHALEYVAILDDPPDAGFIGPLSAWRQRT